MCFRATAGALVSQQLQAQGLWIEQLFYDVLAELLETAGCKDVTTEPLLIPVNGRELPAGANKADGARLDVSARSVWNPLERAFLDVRVFHAQAPSNKALGSPTTMYNSHERQKKNLYNKRIVEVEHGTFTPIVLSTTGGMGREANKFFKKLADKLSRKSGQRYSEAISKRPGVGFGRGRGRECPNFAGAGNWPFWNLAGAGAVNLINPRPS